MMTHRDAVCLAARGLELLDAKGELIALDSVALVALTAEIEHLVGFEIPNVGTSPQNFASIDTVVSFLDRLKGG